MRVDRLETVVRLLRERAYTLAVAESCTGGALSARITDLPGVSDVFLGGVVSYANAVKSQLLFVDREVLAQDGAVSPAVAKAMAEGVKKQTGAAVSVALTGIAGPGGATAEKPLGLVYIALSLPGFTMVKKNIFSGDRAAVRRQAVERALELLEEVLGG